FGAAFRDKGLPNQIKDNVLNGEIYHGMAEFPQETFVTGFFANELENTIGVPFTYEGEQYALFIDRILNCYLMKCIIYLLGCFYSQLYLVLYLFLLVKNIYFISSQKLHKQHRDFLKEI